LAQAVEALPLRGLLEWLRTPSPAARYGIKWGAAVTAALWLGQAYGLPEQTWLAIAVIFVMQPLSGASALKGVLRITGTVAAALVSIALFGLYSQDPPLLMASLFVCLTVAVYGMTGPRYQYAWNVFGFTTVVILAATFSGTDAIETLAFERASLVALGLILVFVADSIFWPVRIGEQLRRGFSERIQSLGNTLSACLEMMQSGGPGAPLGPATPSPLAQQLQLVSQYRMELGVSRRRADAASRTATLLEGLALRTRRLTQMFAEDPPRAVEGPLRRLIEELDRIVNLACREIAKALEDQTAPRSFARELGEVFDRIDNLRIGELDEWLRSQASEDAGQPSRRTVTRRTQLIPVLRDLVTTVGRIEREVARLVGPEAPSAAAERTSPSWRLRIDPFRLQIGMRAGLAGCIALALMLAFGWPVNAMAVIVAFIASAAPTRPAGARMAGGLLAAGLAAWALADLAIVFLLTHLDRMPLSLLFPFSVVFSLGYLAVSRPRLAPFVALVAVMVILPIFGGPAPPQNVEAPYDTAVYLLLGVASALFAQRTFWPHTATHLFWQRSASQLDVCGQLFAAGESDAEGRDEATARSIDTYGTQLALLGQLDGQARQELTNDPPDDERRTQLLGLTQALFDASLAVRSISRPDRISTGDAREDALDTLEAALRRQDQAIRDSIAWAATALRGGDRTPSTDLFRCRADVEARLEEIREDRDVVRALGARLSDAISGHVAARREMASRQLEVEGWISAA
jgi:uncharacterized membrane protein YccC